MKRVAVVRSHRLSSELILAQALLLLVPVVSIGSLDRAGKGSQLYSNFFSCVLIFTTLATAGFSVFLTCTTSRRTL